MEPIQFGPYTLLRKIATGGTAEIFLARRHGVDGFVRHLAIKRILPHLVEEAAFVQLLLDEARLAAHLHNGNIIEIHAVGVEQGQAYIAMEYLPGTDVGRLLRAAARRPRRVLVVHRSDGTRTALCNALAHACDVEILAAADADGALAFSASGPLDLAVIEAALLGPIRDPLMHALQCGHPELLRTVLVGRTPGRHHGIYAFGVASPSPEAVAEVAQQCMRPVLPLEIAVQIVRAVLDGLDAAHRATDFNGVPLCIVHRDVNPSNVLVSMGGTVKLVDFGIARAAVRSAPDSGGNFVGTYPYMSPEQASGKEPDARSDLFAIGTLLYELIAGLHPYRGENEFATLRLIRETTPVPVTDWVPGIPADLVSVVRRAGASLADDRYPTAADMLAAVEDLVRREGLNLSPKRLAGFFDVVYSPEERAAFGVGGTGYDVPVPATASPLPATRARMTPPPAAPDVAPLPFEIDVDLDDLDDLDGVAAEPSTASGSGPDSVGARHPVEIEEPGSPVQISTGRRALSAHRGTDVLTRVLIGLLIAALAVVAGWYAHWRNI